MYSSAVLVNTSTLLCSHHLYPQIPLNLVKLKLYWYQLNNNSHPPLPQPLAITIPCSVSESDSPRDLL